jgi:hypothetical protein
MQVPCAQLKLLHLCLGCYILLSLCATKFGPSAAEAYAPKVGPDSYHNDQFVCSRALSAEPEGNEATVKWLEDLTEAQQYQAGSPPLIEDVRQLYRLGTNGRVTPEQDACLRELEQHQECLVQVTFPTSHCRPGLD